MFDFSIITSWIHQTLTSVMPEGLAVFIECVVIGVCIVALYAILAILLIYMERKVCGFFQCRLGPEPGYKGICPNAQDADQRDHRTEAFGQIPL